MCKTHNPHNIDKCMENFIQHLNIFRDKEEYEILACCCGHEKYSMTIVIKSKKTYFKDNIFDLVSGMAIPRKRKFYKKDSKGYYYISEVAKCAK